MAIYRKLIFIIGAAWCFICVGARLPGLYQGLWEDEVHYNYVAFHAPNLKHLRSDIDWMMRPVLDYAARKYVWFSPIGLSINERNLALVAWIYAAASLVACLLIPWTP